MKNKKMAYLLARLPIGASFLMHGIVRLSKLSAFAHGMAGGFANTVLPYGLVLAFAFVLPFVELSLGIALLLGTAIRKTAVVGVMLMCLLIFGSSLQTNWNTVGLQMFYGLYLGLLYLFACYNGYGIGSSSGSAQKPE